MLRLLSYGPVFGEEFWGVDRVFSFIGREVCKIVVDFGWYALERNYCVLDYSHVGMSVVSVTVAFVLIVALSMKVLRGI